MSTEPLVRVTKLGESLRARVRAGDWHTYFAGGGQVNADSPPVDYEVEGVFVHPVYPGRGLYLFRTRRNGVDVPGVFRTSKIVRLIAVTENSVYRIECAPPAHPDVLITQPPPH